MVSTGISETNSHCKISGSEISAELLSIPPVKWESSKYSGFKFLSASSRQTVKLTELANMIWSTGGRDYSIRQKFPHCTWQRVPGWASGVQGVPEHCWQNFMYICSPVLFWVGSLFPKVVYDLVYDFLLLGMLIIWKISNLPDPNDLTSTWPKRCI